LRHSRVVETEPWGVTDQPRFLNQVLEVEWQGSARELLRAAKAVERDGGRRSTRRWGPRVIDVDILLFGSEQVSDPDLQIPHPRIAERPFVLAGLKELGAGGAISPGL
jgi:2-amino-4-hydroxy-6-hydroxymethyldihydropteridine diphosphokinase